jgi:beta-lactamase superfamily II metal-dependent hydrolase
VGDAGVFCYCHLEEPTALDLAPDQLAIFVLSVGDGDAIVIRFPHDDAGPSYAVVDAFDGAKVAALVDALADGEGDEPPRIRFVCSTHAHRDHIRGLAHLLDRFGGDIEQFWDSGFPTANRGYADVLRRLIDLGRTSGLLMLRVVAGFEVHHAGVHVAVLSPSLYLRSRHLAYGLTTNSSSVVLRLEYPRPATQERPWAAATASRTRVAILGGDAQVDAWGSILADHPHLVRTPDHPGRLIPNDARLAPLASDFLKVPHHASKRGVSFEVLERLGRASTFGISSGPAVMVTSSATGKTSRHGFPHQTTVDLMREVRHPIARTAAERPCDVDLGIHHTGQWLESISGPAEPAGSVAWVVSATGQTRLYRFADRVADPVDLDRARRVIASSATPDPDCEHCCGRQALLDSVPAAI